MRATMSRSSANISSGSRAEAGKKSGEVDSPLVQPLQLVDA